MQIYFLRHGIAVERPPSGADSPERPLTDEGAERMVAEARGMRRLGLTIDLLLTSPLLRTRQTAEIVGHALGLTPEISDVLAPGCGMPAVLALLEQRSARRVMLVGHEPDLSQIASALTGGSQLQLKKGGLALVELPADENSDGVLHWLLPPRLLRELGAR